MKKIFLITALTFFSQAALAADQIKVDVNGLVCDFCAQALEKVFYKQEAVSDINVDLDNHLVTVTLKDGEDMADDLVSQLVRDSGYDVVGISRDE